MLSKTRFALLVDGGFALKKLREAKKRFPTADDVDDMCSKLRTHPHLDGLELLRIYFYHAPPANDVLVNPIDKTRQNLATTSIFAENESLLDKLEMKSDFALRLGETVVYDWRLGSSAMKSLAKNPRAITANDLVPNITQKGVDLRIGLDIARLSLRAMVGVILVVTGDSDLVPAFKFARREGLRVYLDTLGHGVRRDLKAHTDLVSATSLV
jgi:uncharacterized LabA/DUF88 family protein